MSKRNASKPPPSRAKADAAPQSVEQYAQELCELIVQGRTNQDELRAATAQLGSYAADLRKLVQDGERGIDVVQEACVALLEGLLMASLPRDEAALRHANATERYAILLARELGMSDAEEARVGRAARLHDAGKIALPEALLSKRSALDDAERTALHSHCTLGATLARASASRDLQLIGEAIHGHHENWDGSGYPRGLARDEIPLVARIVKLADVYDRLRERRSYKPPLSHAEACRAILEGRDRLRPEHFDPRLLERFSDLEQWLESLSGGEGRIGA